MAPAIMEVPNDDSQKTMAWPLVYAAPGKVSPPTVKKEVLDKLKEPLWSGCEIKTIQGQVVAVGSFSDASISPIVRKADRELRKACKRDGIEIPSSSSSSVKFAQYDAIFSLGRRRGEVWIELEEGGHPW
jgi:hypothetical protein